MSTSSVFLIEVSGTFYNNSGYSYATIGRTTASTAAGTTAAASTVNVGHLRAGGDGTSNDEAHAVASWHHNAHVHTGGFATYDTPNTTDFVRYCIHFLETAITMCTFLIMAELCSDRARWYRHSKNIY